MSRLSPLLVAAALLTACHAVLPLSPIDEKAAVDLGPADAADQRVPDLRPADSALLESAAPDVAAPDLATPDLPPLDLQPQDLLPTDIVPSTGACTGKQVQVVTPHMVVCEYSGNQCEAALQACNGTAGWELCPAPAYKQLIANAGGSITAQAWIAGCIREYFGGFTAPSPQACIKCQAAACGTKTAYYWTCNLITSWLSGDCNVGLAASDTCHVVGINDPQNASLWVPMDAVTQLSHAVCCKP